MKHRLLAFGLAVCMTLALCACGGDGCVLPPTPDPSESVTVIPEGTAEPSATPIPDGATPTLPDNTDAPGALCPDSDAPSPTPAAIGDPTAPPAEEPTKDLTAAEVYAAVSAAAGVSYDNSTAYIDAFYTSLDLDTLSDYVFYMPPMSTQIEEIFIAKVTSGMAAVKSACRDRQAAMAEDAAFYATTGAYVDSYQLVSEGDWVLFCVCEKASDAVSAFRSSVK